MRTYVLIEQEFGYSELNIPIGIFPEKWRDMEERPPLLSAREAAKILGCTPQHLCLLLRTRRLRGTRVGRAWAIVEDDLREYHASRMVKHLSFTPEHLGE